MKEINKFQEFKADIPLDIQISVLEEAMQIQQDYIKGLEEQLTLKDVGASLLEIQLVDWEHTCGDGCCYTDGKDIILNGEKLDEQNAEDSKNALTAVLTKLGYKVDIN